VISMPPDKADATVDAHQSIEPPARVSRWRLTLTPPSDNPVSKELSRLGKGACSRAAVRQQRHLFSPESPIT
jgi:hypothetical protein